MNIELENTIVTVDRFKSVFLGSDSNITITKKTPGDKEADFKKAKDRDAIGRVKILLVDDLKDNLLALEGLLRRDDIEIFTAKSGTDALEFMITNDFALAIIDVQMPGMSGFELAEFMRGAKKTKNIPIIFVTAAANEQNFSFKGYESGAVDFLLKPLDAHAVKSKVNIFIELYRQKKELRTQLAMITDLVEALNDAKVEAEQANASKTQFLANMSHEIRTPIGAILGFNDLMKNPDNSPEENRHHMAVVERNSHQLLKLIDDILDLSKVDAGMLAIESIPFSITELLADFSAAMKLKAEAKGIQFVLSADQVFPKLICSDQFRLQQILTNIVGNALKFTSKGHVTLSISYAPPILKFVVTDTGIGISKDHESRLFQPFSQADISTTRMFGGTGLGLVLSRRLAEALGGRLELINSTENVGSTFLIEIKATMHSDAKLEDRKASTIMTDTSIEAPQAGQILRGLKVLLVEDSPDNQMLITAYLNNEGADVESASDGAEGVKLALAKDFDVLLMDIQMPVLDGHEATRQLVRSKYTKPIIALTAHAMNEERKKCLDSGFTDFLTKPIQRDRLINILSRYVPREWN